MPEYIELNKLTEALKTAYHTNFEDGRTEFALGIILASDIAMNMPKVEIKESEVEGE